MLPSVNRRAARNLWTLSFPLLLVLLMAGPSGIVLAGAPSTSTPALPQHTSLSSLVSLPSSGKDGPISPELTVASAGYSLSTISTLHGPSSSTSPASSPTSSLTSPTSPSGSPGRVTTVATSPNSAASPAPRSGTLPLPTSASPILPASPLRPLSNPEEPYLDGSAETGTCDYPCSSGLSSALSLSPSVANDQIFFMLNTLESNALYNGPILGSSSCVTSSPSLSWSILLGDQYWGDNGAAAYEDEYVYTAVDSGTGTLTVNFNQGCIYAPNYQGVQSAAGMAFAVENTAPAGAVVVGSFNNCGNDAGCPNPSASLATPNTEDTLMLAFLAGYGGGIGTTSGWTSLANTEEGTYDLEAYSEYDDAASAGSYVSNPSQPSEGVWGEVVIGVNALAAGPITPTSVSIDEPNSITLTANPSGGTTPYQNFDFYSSSSNTGSCSVTGSSQQSGSADTYVPSPAPSAGTIYYCYTVTDDASTPLTAESAWDTIVVNSQLVAPLAPTETLAAMDVDQTQSVSTHLPSTGTAGYSWTWMVQVGGSGPYTATSLCLQSTGTNGASDAVETCTIPGNTLSVGSTYSFELNVSDSSEYPESVQSSGSTPFAVDSQLTPASTPSVSSAILDLDQAATTTETLSSTLPSTGTPTYDYEWEESVNGGPYSEASACAVDSASGVSAGTYTCSIAAGTFVSTGTYAFYLGTSDSATMAETATSPSTTITVNSQLLAPAAPTLSPSVTTMDADQGITASTSLPTTGTASYSWTWEISVNGAPATPTSVCDTNGGTGGTAAGAVSCIVDPDQLTPGTTVSFVLQVTDSATLAETVSSSGSATVTVNSALTAPGQPGVSAALLDADQSLQVSWTLPSSGTAPYNYLWQVSVNGGSASPTSFCLVNSGTDVAASTPVTCSVSGGSLTAGNDYVFSVAVQDSASIPDVATSTGSASVVVSSPLSGPPSPVLGASALDVDQPITVTVDLPLTGTAPYSWTWYITANLGVYSPATVCGAGESGSGGAAGAPETCTIPGGSLTVGTSYTFEVQVTDGATVAEMATSSVSPALVPATALTAASTPTPSVPALDVDQAFSVSSMLPTTGTPTYTWVWWYSDQAGVWAPAIFCAVEGGSGAAGGSLETCAVAGGTLTAGLTYSFELEVNDSATTFETQMSAASSGVLLNPALTAASAPSVSAPLLDADQALAVTASLPTTGTPTYSWTWWVAVNGGAYAVATVCAQSTGSAGLAGATETCAVAASALTPGSSYTFEISVSDSAPTPESATSGSSTTVTVTTPLSAGSIAPSSPSIDNGQSIALAAAASGGTGSYTYQWFTGASCVAAIAGATFPTVSVSPSSTTGYSYQVTDSASAPEVRCSVADTVTVNPTLVAGGVLPVAPTVDLGQSVTLYSAASEGTPAYTYQWYSGISSTCSLDAAIAGATSPTYAASPTTSTEYCYAVTDHAHAPSTVDSTAVLVTVTADPTVQAPTASVGSVDLGQAVTFSVVASGGSGGFSYAWPGLPPGCGSTSASFTCHPGQAGTYTITVQATDSNGFTVTSAALDFSVYALPSVSDPNASVASLDLGQTIAFYTVASAGSEVYTTYTWASQAAFGCDTFGKDPVRCTPTATGTFTLTVQVTDSNGETSASASSSIVVYADPTVTAPSSSVFTGEAGISLSLSTNATGGYGARSLTWAGLPTGCSGTSQVISCVPQAAGKYTITVAVEDANAFSVTSAPFSLTVDGALASPTLTESASTLNLGQTVYFTASASGGVGPYTYGWSGLPAGCVPINVSVLSCNPSAAGMSTVAVTIVDADGASVSATPVTFVVSSPSSTPFFSGTTELLVLGGGIGVVVLIAAILLLLYLRRRKPKATTPPTAQGEPEWKPPAERGEQTPAESPTTAPAKESAASAPAPEPEQAPEAAAEPAPPPEEPKIEWTEGVAPPAAEPQEPVIHSLEDLK